MEDDNETPFSLVLSIYKHLVIHWDASTFDFIDSTLGNDNHEPCSDSCNYLTWLTHSFTFTLEPRIQTEKLAGCDTSSLKEGDLAVVRGGAHVLIYCGNNKWIEASPEDRKVVMNTADSNSKRPWFNISPVVFARWWVFNDKTESSCRSQSKILDMSRREM